MIYKKNKTRFIKILFIALLLCMSVGKVKAAGKVYYVAKNGNDSNSGSESEPWLSIQHAVDHLEAGDTVFIKEGTYNERVTVSKTGSTNQYITVSVNPGDEGKVVVDGAGIDIGWWGGLLEVKDAAYVKVKGFKVVNSDFTGIFVNRGNNIIVQDNETVHTASSGIYVFDSSYVWVDSNNVRFSNESKYQECISVVNTNNFEVKNNEVHDGVGLAQGGEGIDVKTSGDGGISYSGKVYGNYVHDLPDDVGIYVGAYEDGEEVYDMEVYNNIVTTDVGIAVASEQGGLSRDIKIFNNITYNNEARGIKISSCCGTDQGPKQNIKIFNNTVYNTGNYNQGYASGGGILIEGEHPQDSNFVVANNIVSQGANYQILIYPGAEDNTIITNNLIDGFRDIDTRETYGDNHQEGDPLFKNPSNAEFSILAGSPAIDNASASYTTTLDFEGNTRPQGTGYDIGAYEYIGGESILVFPDVPESNQFYQYIMNLYEDEIISGYSNGLYGPKDPVKRDQMAKFIVRAFNLEVDTTGEKFPDVTNMQSELNQYVQTLKNLGIVSGYSDGNYYPGNPVTRGQVSKFVVETMRVKGIDIDLNMSHEFPDIIGSTFEGYIAYLTNQEVGGERIVRGYSDGTYKQDLDLNREQMAKIIDLSRKYS
ncbi:hypothetical protein GF362_04175 [Candidatus Dojkabacteria bacterium]|nr:hypothetical protein [Candidatus Dojkabacteria bacterium]